MFLVLFYLAAVVIAFGGLYGHLQFDHEGRSACAVDDSAVPGAGPFWRERGCHACLLVPETSCEARNSFLDRELLGATVADTRAGLSGE